MKYNSMVVVPVALTNAEKTLVDRIEFDALKIKGGVEEVNSICSAARELAQSLLKRKAIPEHRLRFFVNPEYNIGGHGSSRKDILERNARGGEILDSVHVSEHLRYFIYGPLLSGDIIESFDAAVKDCGMVTSGDIIPLGDTAKKLVRRHSLDASAAAEEFYKLALEHGMQVYEARSIRNQVKRAR